MSKIDYRRAWSRSLTRLRKENVRRFRELLKEELDRTDVPMPRQQLTPQQRRDFRKRALAWRGLKKPRSYDWIAKTLGISHATAWNLVNKPNEGEK